MFDHMIRSDHRQAHRDLRSASAGRRVPQSGGSGGGSDLRRRVHDRAAAPGRPSIGRRAEDRGVSGHIHRWSDLQRLSGGLREITRWVH